MSWKPAGHPRILPVAAALLLLCASCAELKQSRPLLPVREYERMIVGRLDAEYVGTANCVSPASPTPRRPRPARAPNGNDVHAVPGEPIRSP